MQTLVIPIPTDEITDWESFHTVFQIVFGFPDFYGRNMDAWIDCMSCLDDAEANMTKVCIDRGDLIVLKIDGVESFRRRCTEQYETLIACISSVNRRSQEIGEQPFLALLLSD
jgi:hypothetical protein